jgi:hypothetical protein
MAEATAIGTKARHAPRPATPANGGTTARTAGMNRLRKIAQVPCAA